MKTASYILLFLVGIGFSGDKVLNALDELAGEEAESQFLGTRSSHDAPSPFTTKQVSSQSDKVYVCGDKHSNQYHSTSSCTVLSNCQSKIYWGTKDDVLNYGYSTCATCWVGSYSSSSYTDKPGTNTGTVIVCGGQYATKCHSSASCWGLNNCKGDLYEISRSDAIGYGRSPCAICY